MAKKKKSVLNFPKVKNLKQFTKAYDAGYIQKGTRVVSLPTGKIQFEVELSNKQRAEALENGDDSLVHVYLTMNLDEFVVGILKLAELKKLSFEYR